MYLSPKPKNVLVTTNIKQMKNFIANLNRNLSFFLEAQKNAQKMAKKIKLSNYAIPDILLLANQIADNQRFFHEFINSSALKAIQRHSKELPVRTQKAILILAEHGWYLDFKFPFSYLWTLQDALTSGYTLEVEEALIQHFEKQLPEIEDNILARFPRRGHIISSAFKAHRQEEYFLSIPVLLIQIDGICKDVTGEYFFMRKKKKPRTAVYAKQTDKTRFKNALLSPLANVTPICASEHEREDGFDLLNRHTVLHGESLDYGSKVNGLKAISLINYVAQVLDKDE